jgi:regulator of sigma E protease
VSVGAAILALAFLVLVHEAGHFVVARWVGMRPRKFYIGFGPAIVKRVRGRVEYGIGALPLGGYVKIPGMHRPAAGDLTKSLAAEVRFQLEPQLEALDAAIERGDDEGARQALAALRPELGGNSAYEELDGGLATEAYWRQSAWKRVVVIAAGPATNVLFALVLFIVAFMLATTKATRTVEQALAGRPAAAAGVKAGDEIVRVAGYAVTPDEIPKRIRATHGRPFTIVVLRKSRRVTIGPLEAKPVQGTYEIGVAIKGADGPGESFPAAVGDSVRLVGSFTSSTVGGMAGLVVGHGTRNISSAVGIVRDESNAFKQSLQDFLGIVGLISLALALVNLLPVLPFDGGHIVMSIIERLRGRTFSQQAYLRYSAVGLSLFMILLYLGLRNDLFSNGS